MVFDCIIACCCKANGLQISKQACPPGQFMALQKPKLQELTLGQQIGHAPCNLSAGNGFAVAFSRLERPALQLLW